MMILDRLHALLRSISFKTDAASASSAAIRTSAAKKDEIYMK